MSSYKKIIKKLNGEFRFIFLRGAVGWGGVGWGLLFGLFLIPLCVLLLFLFAVFYCVCFRCCCFCFCFLFLFFRGWGGAI